MKFDYEVIIVGGGPAGLSAALLLARSLRKVLVCDQANQRNRFSEHMHAFLSRDGINPREFLELSRKDIEKYQTVEFLICRVVDAKPIEGGFRVEFEKDCEPKTCKKLLLATGVTDLLPVICDVEKFYGKGVYHCPYCDGWEQRGKRLCAYGKGEAARQIALELTCWSPHVVLLTDGPAELDEEARSQLRGLDISVNEQPIACLEGDGKYLKSIKLQDGTRIDCDAMFFKTARFEKSHLACKLGCDMDDEGFYKHQKFESTNVPNLFVAGDACRSLNLVVEAAASGAEAAFAINSSLIRESIKSRLSGK